jgi:hypothetical protein
MFKRRYVMKRNNHMASIKWGMSPWERASSYPLSIYPDHLIRSRKKQRGRGKEKGGRSEVR